MKDKFLRYQDVGIETLQYTVQPNNLIQYACELTQGTKPNDIIKTIKFLVKANHTSLFEHAIITFKISNVSRSFLAQITRHRMASYTASSQHYQEYDVYPNVMDAGMSNYTPVMDYCNKNDEFYRNLINMGIPKEEARQILINAKAVNLIWTINARSLMNFLNIRLCKRNIAEMFIFATTLHQLCKVWWSTLFSLIGPDCEMHGHCTQGYMQSERCKGGIYDLSAHEC